MLITPEAWTAMLEAGLVVRPAAADRVEVLLTEAAGPPATFVVERKNEPLVPSQVHRLATASPSGRLLLVVPSASDAALAVARQLGVSVIALNDRRKSGPTGFVLLPQGEVVLEGRSDDSQTKVASRPGRRPWGTYSVVRLLLEGASDTQQEMAQHARVSQPRVSQALRDLEKSGLLRRRASSGGRHRWEPTNWDALLAWWLGSYPGPGGITTYWYGLDPPGEQARAVVRLLAPRVHRVAVSGDVAADVVAPWRRPVRAVVYAEASGGGDAVDLAAAGLTPAGAEEATLELTVPEDPGLWLDGADVGAHPSLPVADLLQVLWDVRRAPGVDADQAVEALMPALRSRAAQWASARER